ncbi:MAG: YraN family protein [Bdellovibrionales bacterium]|nr:YraN family protein [Bdellovibrionales bacterium]
MSKERLELGALGEQEARMFLEKKGYIFVAQNHRSVLGEIDLIMEKDGKIIFVEVKTGNTKDNFSPLYRVGYTKQKKLLMLGEEYLGQFREPKAAQFDVVCIEKEAFDTKISHYQNVIHP